MYDICMNTVNIIFLYEEIYFFLKFELVYIYTFNCCTHKIELE